MLELLSKTGLVGWIILFNSILATTIFIERLFHLRRAEIKTDDFLKGIFNIVSRDNLPEAISMCSNTPGAVAYLTRAALLHEDEDRATLTRAVERAGLEEVPRLERHMGGLLTIAQTSPLLGLFGTTVGLIKVLMTMQQNAPLVQMGDLSTGLWQALITTAAGLAVAIPAYAAHNFLVSKVETIVLDMERASREIIYFLINRNPAVEEPNP